MIFTDRKITIRNGKSTINEPVILYRGDYEVSIKFTIMESKFRFKSGVNLVDSEKASHGQLAILTPYGDSVISEIVKCEDGTVTFTLSKEMIDQLEEVGLYSFQIRLFDYYRESRVSIPPVEFGIEVREPVASEDHNNIVGEGIVGYSIAKYPISKVTDGLNEDYDGPTFDDNGQYNKTDWETGDRISQGKLNKIEDAIDQINQNEKNDVAALDKRVTSNFNVLDASKADTTQMHGLQTQVNNLVLGAVGDGNNPEVIQARGDYNLLNERMQILDSAVKSEKFGYVDLSDPQFISGSNVHRMTINGVPITEKGTVVVHYMPSGWKVYIQHLRYIPETQVFKILSTITVDVTKHEYTKTVCDFKIDTSGNDFIGIEGVDHSTNYTQPGYCFIGWYRGDTNITEYSANLQIAHSVSMGYYVEVFNTNDVEVQEQINDINNKIAYSDTFGYVDLNDPSFKDSCRAITNCVPITKTGKVIVTLNPKMPTIFIQHLRYNGSDTFTILNTIKCTPVGDIVTSIECDFDIDPSGYDYIAVDGAKVSNTLKTGYCILHDTNYTEDSGLTEYKTKLTTTYTASAGFYVTVNSDITDAIDDVNTKIINSSNSLNKLEDDLNDVDERVNNLENHFKYMKSFDAENIEVNMVNKGFWHQTLTYVQGNDDWTYFYHIDEPIPVTPGEVYLIKNIVGTGNLHPILLLQDGNNGWNYVYPDSKEISGTVLYEEILLTIPDNVDYMYLNSTSTKGPISDLSVQKLSNIVYDFVDINADADIANSRIDEMNDKLDETNDKLDELNFELNHLKTRCTKYDNFEFKWGTFDKRYFAITIDDSNSALGGFYDVAHARNIPISTACVWTKLNNVESGGSRTIRDINNLIVADGGEILGHYMGSPTDDTPYETWIELMRTPKKKLEEEGWTIRGLIRADSTPRATNKGQRICREYYDYSDTVGISTHYNMGARKFLIGVQTLDDFKAWVNSCKDNGFYPICVHGLRNDEPLATNENLGAIIDYILSLENVEFTTYRDMFDRFGTVKLD